MVLADLGAEVIKVERPGERRSDARLGAAVRRRRVDLLPVRQPRQALGDRRPARSPRAARSRGASRERADVVVENFLPGGAERLGLGADELRRGAARRSSTARMRRLPARRRRRPHRPGFDFAIQGEAGIMSITGEPDGEPMKVGRRDRRHHDGHVRPRSACWPRCARSRAAGPAGTCAMSLFDAQLAWLAQPRRPSTSSAGEEPERLGNAHPSIVPYETLPGAATATSSSRSAPTGSSGASAPRPGSRRLAADPRFATNPRPRAPPRWRWSPCCTEAIAQRDA